MLAEEIKRCVMEVIADYKALGATCVSGITITNAVVTPDLSLAKIFFHSFLLDISTEDVLLFFERERKNIRHMVGKRLKSSVRSIPELVFAQDVMLKVMSGG
jgi:ribosome-binding factor A